MGTLKKLFCIHDYKIVGKQIIHYQESEPAKIVKKEICPKCNKYRFNCDK